MQHSTYSALDNQLIFSIGSDDKPCGNYYYIVWPLRKMSADYGICCAWSNQVLPEPDIKSMQCCLMIHRELIAAINLESPAGANPFTAPLVRIDVADHWLAKSQSNLMKIVEGFGEDPEFLRELLRQWLKSFLFQLAGKVSADRTVEYGKRSMDLVNSFVAAVKKSGRRYRAVGEFAKELHVTLGYLNKMVKKATGLSARHHIQQNLIAEAKNQAIDLSRSMKVIAYDLGFEDSLHFSKYFKKIVGVSFSEFRKGALKLRPVA